MDYLNYLRIIYFNKKFFYGRMSEQAPPISLSKLFILIKSKLSKIKYFSILIK